MTKVFAIIFFIFVIAWAAGFRLHPENIPTYLPFVQSPKNFRKIDLKTGGSLVGILHRETEKEVTLRTEGGVVGLNRDEIVKITELDSKQARRERYWGMSSDTHKPLLTYRAEDAIYYDKTKAKSKSQGKGKEEGIKESDAKEGMAAGGGAGLNMMTALSQVQDIQDQVMARQEEFANRAQLLDEGDGGDYE